MKTSTGSLSFAGSVKPATGSGSYRVSQEEGWQRNEHKKLGKRKRAAFMLCKHQQVKFPRGQVQFVDTKRFSFHNTTSATSVFTKKTCGFCAHSGIARHSVCCNTVREYTTKAKLKQQQLLQKAESAMKRSEKCLAQNILHKIPPFLVRTAMCSTCQQMGIVQIFGHSSELNILQQWL